MDDQVLEGLRIDVDTLDAYRQWINDYSASAPVKTEADRKEYRRQTDEFETRRQKQMQVSSREIDEILNWQAFVDLPIIGRIDDHPNLSRSAVLTLTKARLNAFRYPLSSEPIWGGYPLSPELHLNGLEQLANHPNASVTSHREMLRVTGGVNFVASSTRMPQSLASEICASIKRDLDEFSRNPDAYQRRIHLPRRALWSLSNEWRLSDTHLKRVANLATRLVTEHYDPDDTMLTWLRQRLTAPDSLLSNYMSDQNRSRILVHVTYEA